MSGSEVRQWLYRCIKAYASDGELFPGQEVQFEAIERLADYVQQLPDDDERFVRLAGAGFRTDSGLPTSCLGSRCMSFGPGLYFGNDPDAWLTEYVSAEVSTLTGRSRINLRGSSS